MKTPKTNGKPKATTRKSVVKAIAKQDEETQQASTTNCQNIHEAIALKAYELYVNRGCAHGYHAEDWNVAEKIVRQAFV